MEVEVPLWLAMNLRKRQQCRVVPPSWLEVSNLTTVLEHETRLKDSLYSIHFNYIEIASLLFNVAFEDIVEVDQVRTLLEVCWPLPSQHTIT
jgi:GINS complex subunit 2